MKNNKTTFNADIGEGIGNEAELLPYLQACNISCGAHAGTLEEIQLAIKLAIRNNVIIGAHPSYEDKENFGRKPLEISDDELHNSIKSQLEFLNKEINTQGGKLTYVKPHGALYHQASTNKNTATVIIKAIQSINTAIGVMGMPNTVFEEVATSLNCPYTKEGFADRVYHTNGSLVSRAQPNSVLTSTEKVTEQVGNILHKKVMTLEGNWLGLNVDSICFHGDTENAITLLKACHKTYV